MTRTTRLLLAAVAAAGLIGAASTASAQFGITLGNRYYGTNGSYTYGNPYGQYGYSPYSYGAYNNPGANSWYYDRYSANPNYGYNRNYGNWNPNRYNNNYNNYFGRNGVYRGYGYDNDDGGGYRGRR